MTPKGIFYTLPLELPGQPQATNSPTRYFSGWDHETDIPAGLTIFNFLHHADSESGIELGEIGRRRDACPLVGARKPVPGNTERRR